MSYLYTGNFDFFIFQLSSLWLIEKSKEMRLPSQHQPLFHHFARRGLASAVSVSEASSASAAFSEDVKVEEELYIEVEKQKKPPSQPRNGKLDLAYLKAMMNLPPQDLQPLTQLQKMAHVAKNSLVYITHISNVPRYVHITVGG